MSRRFWDVQTSLPHFTCRGHRHHVLCTAWAPNGELVMFAAIRAQWRQKVYQRVVSLLATYVLRPIFVLRRRLICGPAALILRLSALTCTGKRFASADRKGEIRLWDPLKGQQQGQPLSAHKQWITSLAWEPLHRNPAGERLASSSKDGLIKVR